jgi:hypothetical protein
LQALVRKLADGNGAQHAFIRGAQGARLGMHGDQRLDAAGAVGMALPFGPVDQMAREMAAGEEVRHREEARRKLGVVPGRVLAAGGQVHRTAAALRRFGVYAQAGKLGVHGAAVGGLQRDGDRAFIGVVKARKARLLAQLRRKCQQLQVIGIQDQGLVARAAMVAALRRQGKAQLLVLGGCGLQVMHPDDVVVQSGD